MFIGSIEKGTNVSRYIKNSMLEIHNLKNRHDELVKEFRKRGFNHKTPVEFVSDVEAGKIDIVENMNVLKERG